MDRPTPDACAEISVQSWIDLERQPMWLALGRLCAVVPELIGWMEERLDRVEAALSCGETPKAERALEPLERVCRMSPSGSVGQRLARLKELFAQAGLIRLHVRVCRLGERWAGLPSPHPKPASVAISGD